MSQSVPSFSGAEDAQKKWIFDRKIFFYLIIIHVFIVFQERRRALETERQTRYQEMAERRRQRTSEFELRQQEKEKERAEAARAKEREREERLAALSKQQQAHIEELQKKIQQKVTCVLMIRCVRVEILYCVTLPLQSRSRMMKRNHSTLIAHHKHGLHELRKRMLRDAVIWTFFLPFLLPLCYWFDQLTC